MTDNRNAKKILMLTMALGYGGAETHILELARALAAAGHDVTVASNGGVYADRLTEEGIRHIPMPLHSKKPADIFRALRALRTLLQAEHFDVIHAHARIPAALVSPLARRFDIPFVTTCHLNFSTVWYWRFLTRTGERALAVSKDLKQYLTDNYHMPADRIDVTVNGIDTAAFTDEGADTEAIRGELALPAGERILTVSRIDRQCAAYVYRLIEAMPQIVRERPTAHLVIVGGGDVLEEIRALAARVNGEIGEERIFLTGPRRDIAKLLPAADVFVGVSRAAMEAMATRRPVILSGHQGHLGIFGEGVLPAAIDTNFCCRGYATATADTLAAEVIAVLSADGATRRNMGAYNRSVIETHYSAARMAQDAVQMYEKAIRAHVPRRAEVVISGYYGYENAGDDALLCAIADGLRAHGITKIGALSKSGAPAVGVKAISRFNIFAVHRALRGAKLLISGGGSLLQDATSTRSLLYYASLIRFAKRVHVPVMIFANGIGPLTSARNRKIAADAILAADCVSVRDKASFNELIAMGIPQEKIVLTADPVYRVICADGQTDAPSDKLIVSLRELAGAAAKGADTDSLTDAVVRALTAVCRDRSLTAVLLPMQPRYDAAICARVQSRLAEAGADAVISEARSAEEIENEIRGARAVLGMRLHTLIFATALSVPSAAISYDPKIDALMDYLGMAENTLSHDRPCAEEIEAMLCRVLTDTEAPAKLRTRTAALRALAEADIARAAALYRAAR